MHYKNDYVLGLATPLFFMSEGSSSGVLLTCKHSPFTAVKF